MLPTRAIPVAVAGILGLMIILLYGFIGVQAQTPSSDRASPALCGTVQVSDEDGEISEVAIVDADCAASKAVGSAQPQPQVVPPVPFPVFPPNGSVLQTLIPVLIVDTVLPTDTLKSPQIQMATNAQFTQNVWSMTFCASGNRYVNQFFSDNLLANTLYYWRVRSANQGATGCPGSSADWSAWSEAWTFRTGSGGTPPNPPGLVSPPNGGTLPDNDAVVVWQQLAAQRGYRAFYKRVGSASSSSMVGWDDTATSVRLWGVQAGNSYEWWVRIRDDYAWSSDSSHYTFTVYLGPTPTATATGSITPPPYYATCTPTSTKPPAPTSTQTPMLTPSQTLTPTSTQTPTLTPSQTLTPTATVTATPSSTPTPTPTATATPTFRPTLPPGIGYRIYFPIILLNYTAPSDTGSDRSRQRAGSRTSSD